ncbi:MAG: SCP2 sterol-binding domain-containing protein [Candidatus Aminicenantes bacterium]|nr:MAG: SCP2 sterol-binding domain-containing protein [Candidatus Aminicenantes bacterium]
MSRVEIIGEELNGLGMTLKQIIETNLKVPDIKEKVGRLKGSLVVREKQSGISSTIIFDEGDVGVQNDAIERPAAFIEAGFLELADISSGRLGPVKALLAGKIKAKGNLIKLLKMSQALISRG